LGASREAAGLTCAVLVPKGKVALGKMAQTLVHGARVSLFVGIAVALGSALIGMLVGGVAGFIGGWVDDLLMRVTELFQLLPRFFLAILVAALFGSSIFVIVVLLAATFWPATARLLRGQVLSLRPREFVFAARATGVRECVIFARHVLPNALPPVLVSTTLQIGGAILVEDHRVLDRRRALALGVVGAPQEHLLLAVLDVLVLADVPLAARHVGREGGA